MNEKVAEDVDELDLGTVSRAAGYRKAIVAVLTVLVVAAASFGIEVDEGLRDALVTAIAAVGALGVWGVPNESGEPVELDTQGRDRLGV